MNLICKSFQFPEVRVVEASAGSGKTFALAKRYVQLVLSPQSSHQGSAIRSILAITFMKKASFEMKQRILAFLKAIALKTMPQDQARDILDPVGLDADKASAYAFDVMEELIHHYNFFQVQTIDSFINALLSGCAFKIGLSSRFRIKHNPFDYLSYSLDRLIEHATHNPETAGLFADFLDQYLLLENKGNWFPKKDILGLLNALYHQRNCYGKEFASHPFNEKADGGIVDQMKHIVVLVGKLQEKLPQKTHATFRKALDKFLDRYKTVFDFDALSNFFQRENFPITGKSDVPGEVADLWEEIRMRITQLAETEAYVLFSPYIAVFEATLKEFQAKTEKEDVMFMEALNRNARKLFDEGGLTVEELYYRLATRFRHYMIDEFQDTSVIQLENLFMMLEEALSTGGSLFYVGDKKQAIYGFRGGEVALFDQLKSTFAHFNVNVERLKKNYRSYQAVVEFNNHIFHLDNLHRFVAERQRLDQEKKKSHSTFKFSPEDSDRLVRTFDQCGQEFLDEKKGGYVRVERIAGTKRQERDEIIKVKVVALVQELHQRFAWKDIAVLTRKNSEVQQVTSWLMESGVPVKSERTLNITENALVQDLVAFLTFLNSPIDNLAFARVILSEVFCRASGLKPEDMHAFIFELRKKKTQNNGMTLYREFRKTYPGQWDQYIAPFFRSIGFYPLYELFVSVVRDWKVLEHFDDQCGFVMKLLEVIKKREEDGCDVTSFLEYFEKLRNEDVFVNVAQLDSVEILTTHKSKGLEFKVVVLPFAAMEVQVGSRGGAPGEELGQRSFILNSTGEHMELLRIKTEYLAYSDQLYQIYRAQAVEALFSELNNIYVSFTRAEEEMYVFVPERSGQSFNLLNLLIPEDLVEIGKPVRVLQELKSYKPVATSDDEIVLLPSSSYRDWISYLSEEFAMERSDLMNRKNIQRGIELHAALANVGADASGESVEIKDLIERDHLKFLFDTDGEVFTEKEIVDKRGRTKRIDRLIVLKDEVIVVDYKTARMKGEGLRIEDENEGLGMREHSSGTEEGKGCVSSINNHSLSFQYHEQVRSYMDLVKEMYSERKVRGFLLYLDEMELEEVSVESDKN